MTTIEDFINGLEIPFGNTTEPNSDFTIQECVQWYYENHSSEFWKSKQSEGLKLDYNTLLELVKNDYTPEGFEAAFNECMEINKSEGKSFKQSIIDTLQSFEQALVINEISDKMGKYISSAIVRGIIGGDKQDLYLVLTLVTLIIQDKINPDNLSGLSDILNEDDK